MMYETGTLMNGTPGSEFVDVVADYNALYDPDLIPSVAWTPALFTGIDPTYLVIPLVKSEAGPFNWWDYFYLTGSKQENFAPFQLRFSFAIKGYKNSQMKGEWNGKAKKTETLPSC
jgi:hypothetical protein